MRIRLIVEYDGGAYCGWQYQKERLSVQEALEKALFVLFKQIIRITASGRTDRGVHARNQVVHLDIPEFDLQKLKRALNGLLPADIVVKQIEPSNQNFHARFDAVTRRYRYTLALRPTALNRRFCWTVFYPLNLTLMQQGAERLKRVRNFQAFCKVRSEVKNYLCEIYESRWLMQDDLLIYEITANRFLHGMVRAIVGTLVELGRGVISLEQFRVIIESRDRKQVKRNAPPQGLVLEEVIY